MKSVLIEGKEVFAPDEWSDKAVQICKRIYMTAEEDSIGAMVARVVFAIANRGEELGYFEGKEKTAFISDLRRIVLAQKASFNTPVWCNVGVEGRSPQAWACARGDTLMLTDGGLRRLDSLADSDAGKLFTPGGWSYGTVWYTGMKSVVTVLLSNGLEITTTPDHKFVVGETLSDASELLGTKLVPMLGDGSWNGDDLGIVSLDLARLGFLQGDGSFPSGGGAVACLGKNDFDVEPLFEKYAIRKNTGRYIPLNDALLVSADRLGVSRLPLPVRGMPEGVYGLTPAGMGAWLNGLFSANGTIDSENIIMVKTTCLSLAKGVQRCLLALGMSATLRRRGGKNIVWNNGTYDGKDSFEVRIVDRASREIFANRVGFLQDYKEQRLSDSLSEPVAPAYPRTRHYPTVISVEDAEKAAVFDFYVSDDSHVAWANGFAIHNCLILGVEDSMKSIEEGWIVESQTFQGGSGSGVNLSNIRADGEPLSDGAGVGSGPISLWMRPTDAIAGVVRSGGRTRRAAKMVIMDAEHPEIEKFVWLKARAENISRELKTRGYGISMNGEDMDSVPFQNANLSVRVDDLFMEQALSDGKHVTRYRRGGAVAKELSASELLEQIATAAWECGDPGIQFQDTINAMNPVILEEEIRASNPCGEYLWLDNTVCNLGSINLRAFYDAASGTYDTQGLAATAFIMTVAMDILVDLSSYPNEKIGNNSKLYRTLGLGFTNLGALLMSMAVPYDSIAGRDIARSLMGIIMGAAVQTSQTLAQKLEPYPKYLKNYLGQEQILTEHRLSALSSSESCIGGKEMIALWREIDTSAPMRNAQLTVIAPTGTISLMMDCESTGIEPIIALDATKNLVGGGTIDVGVQQCIKDAIANGAVEDGPVFQTALGSNPVAPLAHVAMLAAVQPFVSGGISKTVNLPNEATVGDVLEIYQEAWHTGCKSITVFRDGCKAFQPVNQTVMPVKNALVELPDGFRGRKRPPGTRQGITHKFDINGQEHYVTINFYEDGKPCEIFIKNNKHGSTTGGWADAFSIAASIGLQYGVPIEKFIEHFRRMNFAPQGFVKADSQIKMADSPVDYIFRLIEARYASQPTALDVVTATRNAVIEQDGQQCWHCGSSNTVRTGTCMLCRECGETSGCS